MAGAIAKLFGGLLRPNPPEAGVHEAHVGIGGYTLPTGPSGETGFPGSTGATRTFKGLDQRPAEIHYDRPAGAQTGLTANPVIRQASRRYGDKNGRRPRQVEYVVTPQDEIRAELQHNNPTEFFGGQPLKTRPGSRAIGLNPLSGAASEGGHSVRETETPVTQRQPVIGAGTPGAQNVRNQVAERYKNAPGQAHTYKSAPRADQANNEVVEAGNGNGPISQEVTVQNRFQAFGTGNQTWSVERQMPYTGRGNGARGAALNGQRYYGTFNGAGQQFMNAGQGQYGVGRSRGPLHRPTQFVEPAPWSANYVDTSESVGTADAPGTGGQAPDLTYVSPSVGRRGSKSPRG